MRTPLRTSAPTAASAKTSFRGSRIVTKVILSKVWAAEDDPATPLGRHEMRYGSPHEGGFRLSRAVARDAVRRLAGPRVWEDLLVDAPLKPPVKPMLARLARELPHGEFVYEPKWDGFRCLAFRDGRAVDLRSRNDRPLARYFPELVSALTTLAAESFVVDGEIVIADPSGFDFEALLKRLHPAASRVTKL